MKDSTVIIIAEDSVPDLYLVREALKSHLGEYELLVARDGDEVRGLLNRVGTDLPKPDLLLLDLNMPGIDGPELFALMRQHPLCVNVPLVVLTSSDSPADHKWTNEFNVSHYFHKPTNFDQFMQLGVVVRGLVG